MCQNHRIKFDIFESENEFMCSLFILRKLKSLILKV